MGKSSNHGDPVYCQNPACRREIGKLYAHAPGVYLLQVGSLLIKNGQAMFCVHCGQLLHWSINDQRLENMLRQATEVQDIQETKGY